MKLELILLAVLALAGTSLFFQTPSQPEDKVLTMYNAWKQKFNQNTNGKEDEYRFAIFSQNYKIAQEFNAKNSFTLGVENQFAAMTNEEFREIYTNRALRNKEHVQPIKSKITTAPTGDIDWVSKGAVYAIQNQAQCGSCWAFSAVSQLEGWWEIQGNTLTNFSEQQVVSCDTQSYGCNGGYPDLAFSYVASQGLETAQDYPYTSSTGVTGQCNYNASQAQQGINKSYTNVTPQNPEALYTALQTQPISICVDGGSFVFQLYSGGVIDSDSCGTSLDHAISLTGYSSSNNGIWTVRNSWGTTWGEAGYAQIAYSTGAGYCGINMEPSYPTS